MKSITATWTKKVNLPVSNAYRWDYILLHNTAFILISQQFRVHIETLVQMLQFLSCYISGRVSFESHTLKVNLGILA